MKRPNQIKNENKTKDPTSIFVKEILKFNKAHNIVGHLSEEEIRFYITNYKPFDKAGSYGIQEWIGNIGIEKINGSYNNVVGLPTAELYQKLKLFI